MADIRINALATTAVTTASDDFFAIDGTTNGTRKMSAYNPVFSGTLTTGGAATIGGNLTVSGTTASTSTTTGALVVSGGVGVAGAVNVGGNLTVVGSTIIATQTPASAAASGTAGTIAWDSSYIYVCTATNTWKRVAIATW